MQQLTEKDCRDMLQMVRVMKHTLGWPTYYRNGYVAPEGGHAWDTLQMACNVGFVEKTDNKTTYGYVFAVTSAGKRFLKDGWGG